MSSGSGLDAVLGVAAESAWGTYQEPDRHMLFNSEDINLTVPRVTSPGIGTGERVDRTDQWTTGRRGVTGTVTADTANVGFGLFFEHALGGAGKIADGAGWKHTFTVDDLRGKGLTFQAGRPSTDGTVQPFSYVGCKIAQWRFTQAIEGFLSLALTLDGRDEDTVQALVPGSAPTNRELFAWKTLAVTVDGAPFKPTNIEAGGANALKTDRYFFQGTDLKDEQLENGKRAFTGTLSGEFESMTQYNRFINADSGDPDSMVPIVFTWEAVSEYDSGKPFKLVLTFSACRFDGTTPGASGPDVLVLNAPFVALSNGSDEPCTIDLYTSDTAP